MESKNQSKTSDPQSTSAIDSEVKPPVTEPTAVNPTLSPAVVSSSKSPWFIRSVLLALLLIAIGLAVIVGTKVTHKNATSTSKHNDIPVIKIGVYNPLPTTWYPNVTSNELAIAVNNQAYEGLTAYQSETEVVPDLAVSWTNPNDNTWIFKLRQGVKFHDGTTMTSKQVVASIMDNLNNPVVQPYLASVSNATATDPYTVEITTSTPDSILTKQLTQVWIYDTDSTLTNDPIDGTGPYTLKSGTKLTSQSQSIQLTAFNDYHGGKPTVGELDFEEYPTLNGQLAALKNGTLDMADLTDVSTPSVIKTVKSYGYTSYDLPNATITFLVPDILKPNSPLANLDVRQAIYDTLNPVAIAAARGDTIAALADQLVPKDITGYNPAIVRPAMNLTKAKSLLAQAGYPKGFSLSILYFAPKEDPVGLEVQKELATIGITVSLDGETDGNTIFQKISDGNFDLLFESIGSAIIDTTDVAQESVIQQPNYDNAQIDALYNQANQTFDAATRLNLLQQLNQDVANNVAVFPLYNPAGSDWAVKPNIVLSQFALESPYEFNWWQGYSTN